MNKETYQDKITLLLRALRNERFRFIIIQHEQHTIRKDIERILLASFPRRNMMTFRMDEIQPKDFFKTIFDESEGIFLLDNFDKLLQNQEFTFSFNQRRDRFSRHPIQFIAFLPLEKEYILDLSRKMPDMWSLRNLVLQLKIPRDKNIITETRRIVTAPIGKHLQHERRRELDAIEKRIEHIKKENPSLTMNLFAQAIDLAKESGEYEQGLSLSDQYLSYAKEHISNDSLEYADILRNKASFLSNLGQYKQSKKILEKILKLAVSLNNENSIARFQNDLALVLQALGDYEGAKELLEKAKKSAEQYFGVDHPTTAVSYSNLATELQNLRDY